MVCAHRSSHTKPAPGHQNGELWPGDLFSTVPPAGEEVQWAQGNECGKFLASRRTGPGWWVLESSRGGEECSRRGLELCHSLCWTWPRDGLPVPATLPCSQQSKRLPELWVEAAVGGLPQCTVVGGDDFYLPKGPSVLSPAGMGELSSTHLLQRETPERRGDVLKDTQHHD